MTFDPQPGSSETILEGLRLAAAIVVMASCWAMSFENASAGAKEPSPRALLERAKTHEQAKEYEAALADYRRFLEARPDHDGVRATIAKLLSWQGQLPEAAALYQDLVTRHPLDDESRVGLARVLSWQQQYDDARREYEQVLVTEPRHLDALRGMADVLSWSGHPDQAIPYYEQVVAAGGEAEVVARLQVLKTELNRTNSSPRNPQAIRLLLKRAPRGSPMEFRPWNGAVGWS